MRRNTHATAGGAHVPLATARVVDAIDGIDTDVRDFTNARDDALLVMFRAIARDMRKETIR